MIDPLARLDAAEARNAASHDALRACLARPRILVIEDDAALGDAYRRALEGVAEVVTARDAEEAVALSALWRPAAVLTDSVGLPAVGELRAAGDRVPVAVVSGRPLPPPVAARLGIAEVVLKPIRMEQLADLVERLIDEEGGGRG